MVLTFGVRGGSQTLTGNFNMLDLNVMSVFLVSGMDLSGRCEPFSLQRLAFAGCGNLIQQVTESGGVVHSVGANCRPAWSMAMGIRRSIILRNWISAFLGQCAPNCPNPNQPARHRRRFSAMSQFKARRLTRAGRGTILLTSSIMVLGPIGSTTRAHVLDRPNQIGR